MQFRTEGSLNHSEWEAKSIVKKELKLVVKHVFSCMIGQAQIKTTGVH